MSSILRKVENAMNPERREGVPPAGGPAGTTAADPRTVPATGHHHGHHGHHGQQDTAYAADANYTAATGPRSGMTSAKGPQSGPLPGPAPNTAGPHRYDLLNKLDPSVDSNMASGSAVAGNPPASKHAHHGTAAAAPPAQQYGATGGGAPEGTYGPHKSRLANALDPRVDSDMDGGRGGGVDHHHGRGAAAPPPQQYGATGGGAPEGTYGPHKSRLANALDPRVDSDMDGGRGGGVAHHHGRGAAAAAPAAMMNPGDSPATGPAPHTAGPHRSDLMNKLDPSVDSTGMGGNQPQQQQHVRRGI